METTNKQLLENEVKFFAKNNMCASCFGDIEDFIETMNELIECKDCFDCSLVNECINELEYTGIEITDDTWDDVLELLKQEAKFWLKDYRKNHSQYD